MMVNKRILQNFFVNNSISQRQVPLSSLRKKAGINYTLYIKINIANILSQAFSNKLKAVMPTLISSPQTAYVETGLFEKVID